MTLTSLIVFHTTRLIRPKTMSVICLYSNVKTVTETIQTAQNIFLHEMLYIWRILKATWQTMKISFLESRLNVLDVRKLNFKFSYFLCFPSLISNQFLAQSVCLFIACRIAFNNKTISCRPVFFAAQENMRFLSTLSPPKFKVWSKLLNLERTTDNCIAPCSFCRQHSCPVQ